MKIVSIDSLEHPSLAPYARLTEAQLRNRLHSAEGLFICESLKVLRVALAAGVQPLSLLAEERMLDSQVAPLLDEFGLPDLPVYVGSRPTLAGLTGYELSRGILCAMRRPQLPPPDAVLAHARRVAVLDGVVNSENTGAIFRAAAALGFDAVLLSRTSCDPLNRRACRVSMGTVFQLPWTYFDHYRQLHDAGFSVVAMALADRSLPLDSPALRGHDRLAVVLGSEGDGLSPAVLDSADFVVRIPMQRGVDSLNVAAAAAVAFYVLQPTPNKQQ